MEMNDTSQEAFNNLISRVVADPQLFAVDVPPPTGPLCQYFAGSNFDLTPENSQPRQFPPEAVAIEAAVFVDIGNNRLALEGAFAFLK